jgi:hypothetical protein
MSVARQHGGAVRSALRAVVWAAVGCCAGVASAAEPAKPTEAAPAHRFYGGVTLSSLGFDDRYGGVSFSDTSTPLAIFGGAYLKERLSLELSYDSANAIDLHDIAGSGVVRFDVKTRRRTEAIGVVREVSLHDILSFRRDWRVFGMAGLYRSDIRRSVTPFGGASSTMSDEITGLMIGGGVVYHIGGLDWRGYFRQFGATDLREARELGIGVQHRF